MEHGFATSGVTNRDRLGEPTDLDEFLFGTERVPLGAYVPILREIQASRCFYCFREVGAAAANIDHFIPWSTYPVNLGHNFVLADSRCNGAKSDHLAAAEHLQRWWNRNIDADEYLHEKFGCAGLTHDLLASQTIARWAYRRAYAVGANTFKSADIFESLGNDWEVITQG